MDLLTLPRLHPSIPSVIHSLHSEKVMLEALRERAISGLPIKPRRSGEPISRALARQIEKWLQPGATELQCFSSRLAIADPEVWGDMCAPSDGFSLCWEADSISSTCEMLLVGQSIQRMEEAHEGLGETVLATLQEVSGALHGQILNTPRDLLMRLDDYYWDGTFQSQMTKSGGNTSLKDLDKAVRDHLMEYRFEGSDDVPENMLPSSILEGLSAGVLDWRKVLGPKRRRKVTSCDLRDAGFTQGSAIKIEQLICKDLPKVMRAFRSGPAKQGDFMGDEQFPAGIVLGSEVPNEVVQFVDNQLQGHMEQGEYSAPFAVPMSVPAVFADGTKSLDPLRVMASFLNLMHRTDQLLAVLCD